MTHEGFKRKLTAILSADVVGYSRLMDNNEEATIRILNKYRTSITSLIQQAIEERARDEGFAIEP
jgi:adenylate cyclase